MSTTPSTAPRLAADEAPLSKREPVICAWPGCGRAGFLCSRDLNRVNTMVREGLVSKTAPATWPEAWERRRATLGGHSLISISASTREELEQLGFEWGTEGGPVHWLIGKVREAEGVEAVPGRCYVLPEVDPNTAAIERLLGLLGFRPDEAVSAENALLNLSSILTDTGFPLPKCDRTLCHSLHLTIRLHDAMGEIEKARMKTAAAAGVSPIAPASTGYEADLALQAMRARILAALGEPSLDELAASDMEPLTDEELLTQLEHVVRNARRRRPDDLDETAAQVIRWQVAFLRSTADELEESWGYQARHVVTGLRSIADTLARLVEVRRVSVAPGAVGWLMDSATTPQTPPSDLHLVLKRAREAYLLTQTEIAKAIGASRSHVSRVERGVVSPTMAEITAWAVHCGCDPRWWRRQEGGSPASAPEAIVEEPQAPVQVTPAPERNSVPPELAPQPPPTNSTGDVWQELIDVEPPGPIRDLMIARREQGIAKYGRPLGRENGRDHTADAIQEALDGTAYSTAAGRVMAKQSFRDALGFLTGEISEGQWVRRSEALSWVKELEEGRAALVRRAESAEREAAELNKLLHLAHTELTEAGVDTDGPPAARIRRLVVIANRQADADAETIADIAESLGLPPDTDGVEIVRAVEELVLARHNAGVEIGLVRRVVARQTDALRLLASSEDPTFRIAVELAADNVDMVVAVSRG